MKPAVQKFAKVGLDARCPNNNGMLAKNQKKKKKKLRLHSLLGFSGKLISFDSRFAEGLASKLIV